MWPVFESNNKLYFSVEENRKIVAFSEIENSEELLIKIEVNDKALCNYEIGSDACFAYALTEEDYFFGDFPKFTKEVITRYWANELLIDKLQLFYLLMYVEEFSRALKVIKECRGKYNPQVNVLIEKEYNGLASMENAKKDLVIKKRRSSTPWRKHGLPCITTGLTAYAEVKRPPITTPVKIRIDTLGRVYAIGSMPKWNGDEVPIYFSNHKQIKNQKLQAEIIAILERKKIDTDARRVIGRIPIDELPNLLKGSSSMEQTQKFINPMIIGKTARGKRRSVVLKYKEKK